MEPPKPCPFCGNPMEWWGDDMIRHAEPADQSCPLCIMAFTNVDAWNRRHAAEVDRLITEAVKAERERCAQVLLSPYQYETFSSEIGGQKVEVKGETVFMRLGEVCRLTDYFLAAIRKD